MLSESENLFDWGERQYPARRHDPLTSFKAAEQIGAHITSLEAAVLDTLAAHGGMTTEEMAARLGISLVTISPRLRPLEKKGRVRRAGTKSNLSGRQAVIWEAV